MITVIIPTRNAQDVLPRCFDSLISATVHGLIREVVLADGGSDDETLNIADAVGARLVHSEPTPVAQLNAGAEVARSDWLLFMPPEVALSPGWDVEVGAFMARPGATAGVFSFTLEEFDAAARRTEMSAQLCTRLFRLPRAEQGLFIRRSVFEKMNGFRDCALPDIDLIRRLGASRLVTFRAQAILKADACPHHGVRPLISALYALGVPPDLVARL